LSSLCRFQYHQPFSSAISSTTCTTIVLSQALVLYRHACAESGHSSSSSSTFCFILLIRAMQTPETYRQLREDIKTIYPLLMVLHRYRADNA